jgi:hypothetical protein
MNNFQMETLVKLNKRRERRELLGSAFVTAMIAVLAWLFFIIAPGLAESSNHPTIKMADSVVGPCLGSSSIACYRYDLDTIFIGSTIKADSFMYVFLHEYGHALTFDYDPIELKARYGDNYREEAADSFYLFVKYPTLRLEDSIKFWSKVISY